MCEKLTKKEFRSLARIPDKLLIIGIQAEAYGLMLDELDKRGIKDEVMKAVYRELFANLACAFFGKNPDPDKLAKYIDKYFLDKSDSL